MPRIPRLPATGVYCYLTVFYRQNGKVLSFKLWWTGSSVPGAGYNADTAADALYGSFGSTLLSCLTAHTIVSGYKLSVRNALLEYSGTNYVSSPGIISGVELPDEVNVVLRRVTLTPGGSGRGRIRLAGVPDSYVDGNYVNATGTTAYVALCTAFKAATTDQGITWSPANFSPKTSALHAAIDFKLDQLTGTDRRRRLRF